MFLGTIDYFSHYVILLVPVVNWFGEAEVVQMASDGHNSQKVTELQSHKPEGMDESG